MAAQAAQDLEDVLGELKTAAHSNGRKVSVGEIVDAFGRRSFGPLLMLCGLLGMTPVAAVPTAPSTLAVITALIAGQLLFGRERIWLPRVLERLSVRAERVDQAVRVARKPVRVVDRIVRPRLLVLTGPVGDRVVALACVLVAAIVPPLELLPFVAFIPALAIATFGVGLIARDGLVVLIALVMSTGALGFAAWKFLG
jgi:hypothetical protein